MFKTLAKIFLGLLIIIPIFFFILSRTQTANAILPGDCNDGADNDWDGLIDGRDPDCTSPSDPSEGSLTYAPCTSTYSGPSAILSGVSPRVTINNMTIGHTYIIVVYNNQNIPTYQSPNIPSSSTPRTHSIPSTAFPNSNQTYTVKVFDLQNVNAPCRYPFYIVVLDSIKCSYDFSPKNLSLNQDATVVMKLYNTQTGYQYKGIVAHGGDSRFEGDYRNGGAFEVTLTVDVSIPGALWDPLEYKVTIQHKDQYGNQRADVCIPKTTDTLTIVEPQEEPIVPVEGKNPCEGGTCNTALGNISTQIGPFASKILSIGIGLAGGIALIIMVIGSIRVLTSAGDPKNVAAGREMIIAAVAGLIFLIFSITIMRFIGLNILGICFGPAYPWCI